MIGTTEILIIVAVVLVLFGARAIPKFARSVGQAKREFEKGLDNRESGDDTEKSPDGRQNSKDTSTAHTSGNDDSKDDTSSE